MFCAIVRVDHHALLLQLLDDALRGDVVRLHRHRHRLEPAAAAGHRLGELDRLRSTALRFVAWMMFAVFWIRFAIGSRRFCVPPVRRLNGSPCPPPFASPSGSRKNGM
jgi:hypothetical protein